jgi:hypothetical protein
VSAPALMQLGSDIAAAAALAEDWAAAERRFQAEVDEVPASPEASFLRLALRLAKARRHAAEARLRELRAMLPRAAAVVAVPRTKVRLFSPFDDEERTIIGAPAYIHEENTLDMRLED